MKRVIMNLEDMTLLGLDIDGDVIKDDNGDHVFVISDEHASSIMNDRDEE